MNKALKYVIAIILATLLSGLSAQNFVDETFAKKIATKFITGNSSKQNPKLDMIHTETDENSEANLYIFNIDSGGFVIISASKKVTPILAYSFENNFNTDGLGNAEYFINNYNRDIELVKSSDIEINSYVSELWRDLESGSIKNRTASVVDPLIETRWNQDCYYNEYAPYDNWGPCSRTYAGCVACAMSQVMKYWNYPEKGKGSHTYIHHQYGSQSADFGSTTYRWDEMPNEIWSHNDAIATLMYHCGVSVNMNYGADGSGAQSNNVETAMRMYFGYSSAKYKERDDYSDEEWIAMLKSELDESRPMYFSGSGEPGGHAIVCDGYDNNDFFHFNMGWSGIGDGFYSIDDVNGFHNDEAVVMDIRPLPINPDDNDIIYVTPDGDGDGSSWENATSELHYAASVASDGNTQIWVKSGTYYGDSKDDKGAFCIYPRNRIYGGFSGNESPEFDVDNRDIDANPTILDGESQRRVIYQSDHFSNSAYSLWDGFTIQNGSAGSGGAIYLCSNSYFYNCKFIDNSAVGQGGAIYSVSASNENSANIFENCIFENNNSSMGGAIFDNIGLKLTNCRFIGNNATTKGGAYYVYMNKFPEVANCLFANNTAVDGGAIYNRGNMTMTNCNVVNNEAHNSKGGLYNEVKYSRFYNSIFWGNNVAGVANQIEGECNLINCAVENGFNGTNIINLSPLNDGTDNKQYPMFKNPDENDYELLVESPLINAGDNSALNLPEFDINYGWRIGQGKVDIGAYEYQGGVDVVELNDEEFEIYPNPARDFVKVSTDNSQQSTVRVYNTLGMLVEEIIAGTRHATSAPYSDEIEINVSDYRSGVYFVEVYTANGSVTKKFIKE